MNFKKIVIVSIFLLAILAIGSAAACENTTDDIITNEKGTAVDGESDLISSPETTTFKDLSDLISQSENLTVLEHNYTFNQTADEIYYGGIEIARDDLTIDGAGHSIDGAGLSRMFNIGGKNIVLKNINFKNGFSDTNGGALYITGNASKIINCTFTSNHADVDGGAVYIKAPNSEIKDSIFINNTAIYNGAALINSENATISDCLFQNNHANISAGAVGWSYKRNGTIMNSRFINNSAVNEGGGAIFWNSARDGKIINSTFKDNTAKPDGGAIFIKNAVNFQISNSTFKNNTATEKGGTIYWYDGNGAITGSVFNMNIAGEDGGAVYFRGEKGIIKDSNFTDNTAYYNGAVYMNSVEGTVYNCIFTENTATNSSGALGWVKKDNGTIAYCKFINNAAPRGGALYLNNGTEFHIRNSIFENNTADINGGAVFWDSGNEGRIIGCSFKNNTAGNFGGAICWNNTQNGYISHCQFDENDAFDGGSVYFRGSNGLITYSDFTNNSAYYNGAIYFNSHFGEIDYCLFENNTAANSSGALGWVKKDNGIINNTKFIGNKAIDGGAIYVNEGNNLTIENSEFLKNSASDKGGAICWDNGINGVIINSCFENNTAASGGAILNNGTINVKHITFKNNTATDGNSDIALVGNGSVGHIPDLIISVKDNTYGSTVKITVMPVYDGKSVDNGAVSVSIGNDYYNATVINGTGTVEIPNLDSETYNVNISYTATDSYYCNSMEAFTFTVDRQTAHIIASDKSYVINYGGKYSITVKDTEGRVLSGVEVTFKLNGKNIGFAKTDANGIASFSLTGNMLKAKKAGSKSMFIRLDNDRYQGNKTVKITVNKEKTKITAKAKTFKKSKEYTATLKNSKGKAVKKVKVILKVKGKTYKATTNSKGKVTFKLTKLTKKGKYTAKITFKGNACYKASTKKVKITVKG